MLGTLRIQGYKDKLVRETVRETVTVNYNVKIEEYRV